MNENEKTNEFLNDYDLQFTARFKDYCVPLRENVTEKMLAWKCTFTRLAPNPREQKTFSVTVYNSAHKGAKPTAYDVLANLIKGDVGTFDDFCIMFGYDKYDETGKINQTAKRVYNCYVKEYKRVLAFFTRPDEMYRLYDIY